MEGHLLMSRKELYRKSVLELVQSEHITLLEASKRLELSYRQTLRIHLRFQQQGDAGLIHQSRGRVSNRRFCASFRKQVLERYRQRYQPHDLGPTLAAEKLAQDGFNIDHETLRRWLLESGDWQKRRKRKSHRIRRERRAHFGELVQMDGSHHAWFGKERPKACLMNMVDDATGATLGLMDTQETTEAAMLLLWRWIERFGVPLALYTDRKNVYITDRVATLEEQLAGKTPKTVFGKACEKLNIAIIAAHSPQAKGRVERSNATYQDRFLKELALRRITTCKSADVLLKKHFCDELNEKFAQPPLEEEDYHRPLSKEVKLDNIFCYEQERVVQNDWTIRHENRYYQILKENSPLPKTKEKILVRTHLDGHLELYYRDLRLSYSTITLSQLERKRAKTPKTIQRRPPQSARGTKPEENHPWRQGCTQMRNEPTS